MQRKLQQIISQIAPDHALPLIPGNDTQQSQINKMLSADCFAQHRWHSHELVIRIDNIRRKDFTAEIAWIAKASSLVEAQLRRNRAVVEIIINKPKSLLKLK